MNGLFRLKPIVAAVASAVAAFGVHAQVPPPAALPAGGRVVAGQAAISQSGSNMLIQQDSAKAILNWNSFNIGSQASVVFQQPSASAIALNRVLGTDPSAIYGSLRANGQVFLINPSGVVFGAGARVDVGGLVASTLNIRDEDFLAGNYRFGREGATGSVLNEGELIGKYVALLAPEVRNEGVIVARQGTAALAAGDAVTLSLTGSDLVGVQVDKASIDTLVRNGRLIQADAGTVILSAQSASALVGNVVNTGAIEANGLTTDGGVVRLVASSAIEHRGSIAADAGQNGKGGVVTLIADLANPGSRTTVAGSISARGGSESGDGGFVDTSASRLKIEDGTRVDTRAPNGRAGLWLLDPTDFTVAATGGDMTGTLLGNNLGLGNVQIQSGTGASGTNGDVFINDPVSWAANTLTITAHRDINVNATMNVTGTGGLAVQYGQDAVEAGNTANFTVNAAVNMGAGTSFTSKLGNDGATKNYTIVTDLAGLQAIDTDPTLNYALGANVVIASGTWTPLGKSIGPFDGTFEGLGHTVSGATYDAVTAGGFTPHDSIGFFGETGNTGRIQNFGVTNVNFTGRNAVGGLVGNNSGSIYNSYSTGTVSASSDTTTEVVKGIGGLVGNFAGSGSIARSYSTATVTATAGDQADDIVFMVPGGGIGGLVGMHVGGGSKISNSYATGAVTGLNNVGGLAGHAAADIEKSYSTGAVSDNGMGGTVGGLVGSVVTVPASPLITDSFWDTQTSGQAGSAGGTGRTTLQMKTAATFTGAGWDTTRIWTISDGSYPVFLSGPAVPAGTITINLNDSTRVYGVTTAPTLTGFSYLGTLLAGDTLTGAGFGSALVNNLAVGDYAYSTPNLISPTFGFSGGHTLLDYTITYSANKLTITPASLTLSGTRVYDATTNVSGSILTANGVLGESFAVTGSGTLANKGVGTPAVQALGTLALGAGSGGALASNYNVLGTAGSAVVITKANLAITGLTADNKVYDATTAATLSGTATVTALGSDVVTVGGTATGTFDTKNFGTGKAVTVTGNTLSGTDAGNYNIVQQAGLTADISKANLSVTGLAASNKVYNTTTAAVLTGTATIAALGTDVVTLGGTATGTFADKNVGDGKAVTVTGNTISGADAANYILVQQSGLTANITKANLAVTGLSASNKVYDTTTTAALTGTAAVTALGSDVVTIGGAAVGAFADKNVGTGKTVTVTGNTISGADAGNYNLVQQAGLTANITKADLAVTGLAASNKVYDGTTTAALTGTATVTALGADVVTVGGTAVGAFADRNFGIGKAVTVTGNTISGADAANYNLVQQAGLTADIAKANLTLSGTRTYDGTTAAAGSILTANGVNGESFSLTGSGTLASKGAGTQAVQTLDTLALGAGSGGASAGNYNALSHIGSAVTISKKALSLLGLTAQDKTFDGNTTATLTGTASVGGGSTSATDGKFIGTDAVSVGGTPVGAFADATVGTGKTVNVTGLTLAGADAANYTLTAALVANITAGGTSTTTANVVNTASNPLSPTTTTGSFRPTTTTDFFRPTPTTTPTTIRPTTSTTPESEEFSTTTTAPPPQIVRAYPVPVVFTPGEPVEIPVESDVAFDPTEEPVVRLSTTGDDATTVEIEVVTTVDEDGNMVVEVLVPEDTPESIITVTINAVDSRGVTRSLVYLFPVRGPSTTSTTASDAL
jgi:filamentous hemagglutinin family protein